jgi:FRG domain
MAPSLCRAVHQDADSFVAAEEEFARKLGERIKATRFKAANVGALLQHYGFKTSWLDVLDNLFVAYWFAAHRISEGSDGSIRVCESGNARGWLFLIRPPVSASVVDLRAEHHPLSARPHVQHGVSLRFQIGGFPDFRDWVVATIQTPVSGATAGSLFSAHALFPPESSDIR